MSCRDQVAVNGHRPANARCFDLDCPNCDGDFEESGISYLLESYRIFQYIVSMKVPTLIFCLLLSFGFCHAQTVSGIEMYVSAKDSAQVTADHQSGDIDSLQGRRALTRRIYLSSKGREIYRDQGKGTEQVFIVRTSTKTEQLYHGGTRDGYCNPISVRAARATERQIRRGNLLGDHMTNVVQIVNRREQQRMLNHIL